ncbi:MAG: DUF1028 domain-containing protein [Anaerolineales bacterium]
MTFSIVACDLQAQAWGVAVASKFPAVGAVVPWAQAGAGALATQSYANLSYGPRGLEMLSAGLSAQETLSRLLADDPQREMRQVGLVDAHGQAVTFTGLECHAWAGGQIGPGFAVQGNILAGAEVIESMAQTFLKTGGALPERLWQALLAGDRAGGDRRGRQSAAIYVVKPEGGYGGYLDRWIDYRVDDYPDPVARLGELLEMHALYFGKSPQEDRVRLEGDTLRHLQRIMQAADGYAGPLHGILDAETRAALTAFIGRENFEERCDVQAGWIDRPVLDFLARRFGAPG